MTWKAFRHSEIWTLDMHDIIKTNLDAMTKLYGTMLTLTKKYANLDDINKLFFFNMSYLNLSDYNIKVSYSNCKFSIIEEAE